MQPLGPSSGRTLEDIGVVLLSLPVATPVLLVPLDLALAFVPEERAFITAFSESLLPVCLLFT